MNKENILTKARKFFSDLSMVSEDIYKGQLKVENKTAGLFFLDLHGTVQASDFKAYQEDILASEYYEQENNLQWNMYFLLIVDQVNSSDKQTIECDEKYARKYIFTENEFLDFFTLDKESTTIQSDIVTVWKRKLDEAGLPQVYGSGTFVTGVNDFISNRSTPSIVSRKKATSDILKIDFINKMTLHSNYRNYPLVRVFEFGKVNLFKGPNGVGKTSALEGIELIACGKTVRNFGILEQDQCIEAVVNDGTRELCTPSKNEKYRFRDLNWYNNDYASGNQLYRSFNRFNFFDSDAANKFSQSNSETDVKQALERLILGPEFKYIKDRVNGFFSRLKPELNKLTGLMAEAKQKVKNAEVILSKEQKSNTIKLLLTDLQKKIKDVDFINEISVKEETLGELDVLINKIIALVSRIQSSTLKITLGSEKQVMDQFPILKSKFNSIEKYKQESVGLKNKVRNSKELLLVTTTKLNSLGRAALILNIPELLELEGCGERLANCIGDIRRIAQVERGLEQLGLDKYSDSELIDTILSDSRISLAALQGELAEVNRRIEEKLRMLNSVERIVAEIREKGREVALLDEDLQNCPLCETQFEKGNLLAKISELINKKVEQGENTNSSDLVFMKLEKERQINALKIHIENVQKIQNCYQILFDRKTNSISLLEVVNSIKEFLARKPKLEAELNKLESLISLGRENDVTEQSLRELKTILLSLFNTDISLEIKNAKAVNDLRIQLGIDKGNLEREINDSQLTLDNLQQDIRSVLGLQSQDPIKAEELLADLRTEEGELNSLKRVFAELHQMIKFDESLILFDLKAKVSEIQMGISSLRQAMAADSQISQAKADLESGNKYLLQNEKYLKRLETGVNVLEELNSKGGDAELSEFFSVNFKKILDVFKTIHAPREFQDLKYHNGEIDVVDLNGELRRVSQISTGQRAALAISIFITMNRMLKNGPNLIIFDDPVSYVDDLNTLSFLDFLRIFVLREKKQIFFATANSRLASLFNKKFGFLGNDLKEWDLKREPF